VLVSLTGQSFRSFAVFSPARAFAAEGTFCRLEQVLPRPRCPAPFFDAGQQVREPHPSAVPEQQKTTGSRSPGRVHQARRPRLLRVRCVSEIRRFSSACLSDAARVNRSRLSAVRCLQTGFVRPPPSMPSPRSPRHAARRPAADISDRSL